MKVLSIGVLFAISFMSVFAQDVPSGVKYKKTTDAINKKAETKLKELLDWKVPDDVILKSMGTVVICGSGMWQFIEEASSKTLKSAMPMTIYVPFADKTQTLKGRGLKKPNERLEFWMAVLAIDLKYKAKKSIRKANAEELSYYWAVISFDIEEPLFIVDYGKLQLLFHFTIEKGEPKIFWVDKVLKFEKLDRTRVITFSNCPIQ